jgi:hypothetical protein
MEEEDSILSKTLHVVTLLTANLSVISFDKPIENKSEKKTSLFQD